MADEHDPLPSLPVEIPDPTAVEEDGISVRTTPDGLHVIIPPPRPNNDRLASLGFWGVTGFCVAGAVFLALLMLRGGAILGALLAVGVLGLLGAIPATVASRFLRRATQPALVELVGRELTTTEPSLDGGDKVTSVLGVTEVAVGQTRSIPKGSSTAVVTYYLDVRGEAGPSFLLSGHPRSDWLKEVANAINHKLKQ